MTGFQLPKLTTRTMAALIGIFACMSAVYAAEVRGTVSLDYQGLFEADGSVQVHPVSVALIPDESQRLKRRSPRLQRIEIIENRMRPAFLTVQKGDQVEFINRDEVFHELFSLSPGEPVSVQLGKTGGHKDSKARFKLDQEGTTHFFCRIHNKSYARIDVVDTPYLQMVQAEHQFHFVGLASGRWKLRLASPAAETRWVPVTAVTSPPALKLKLSSRGGGRSSGTLKPQAGIAQLYQDRSD
jgi:YHS domain-containing protein